MKTKIPIEELVTKVLAELERLRYSHNSMCVFRAFYKRVITFANGRKDPYFSEELGRDFLKEKYNCSINYYTEAMGKKFKDPIRKIRILGDFQLHGLVIRRIVKKPGYVKPPQFQKELIAYEKECDNNEYSKIGLITRMQRLFFFIDYLDARGFQNVNEITAETISDYHRFSRNGFHINISSLPMHGRMKNSFISKKIKTFQNLDACLCLYDVTATKASALN